MTARWCYQQQRRVNRMYDESHYLLSTRVVTDDATVSADDLSHASAEPDAQRLVFDVSGSTGNVYQVTLERNGDRIDTHCTCPDADNYAARYAVACKHCCFVICRVLRQSVQNAESMRTLPLRMWPRMAQRATLLTRHWDDRGRRLAPGLVNETFLERYRSRMQKRKAPPEPNLIAGSKIPSEADESQQQQQQREQLAAFGVITAADLVARQTEHKEGSASSSDVKDGQKDDGNSDDESDCAVCFESLYDKNRPDSGDKQLIRCGECGNCAHRHCIDEWVRVGKHEDCVYCRALLPYALWLQAARDTRGAKRARRQDADDNGAGGGGRDAQQYINVAE